MILVLAEAEKNSNNVMVKKHNHTFFGFKLLTAWVCFLCGSLNLHAQRFIQDTLANGHVIVHKDERVNTLGKKMAEYNESLADKIQMVNGFRLLIVNTSDRAYAMQIRSKMLQQLPEQKIYMTFVSPYIKLKVGNFTDRAEAEKVRDQMLKLNIVNGNIYVVSEQVEYKPTEKNQTTEE
jgi:hypothetical protein